ncbi:MAG: MarR family transcriptional regulator [Desulfotomaculales bacterium]
MAKKPENPQERDLREVIREEMLVKDRILEILREGPKTVPEIAAAPGRPPYEAMLWVMGLRKYSLVAEAGGPGEDGYYLYRALPEKGAGEEGA